MLFNMIFLQDKKSLSIDQEELQELVDQERLFQLLQQMKSCIS